MNANELKAEARERLAEIAKQRAALDAEEREIRVMLGDVPPAPTVSPLREGVITSRTTGCAVPA